MSDLPPLPPSAAVEELARRLAETPDVKFQKEATRLTIEPREGGFPIIFSDDGEEFTVYLDAWHEHFDTLDEAIRCILFALSPRCRVRVTRRGGTPHKWTLESLRDGQWSPVGTTALLLFKFWGHRDEVFLSNGRG